MHTRDLLWNNGIMLTQGLPVNDVRTVSDTKRAFYNSHTRPINSIYRRIVEELIVEMHLLSTNVDFRYDPIYALGVVTAFDRFMQGYRPDQDKTSIFSALCQAVGSGADQYRQSAAQVQADAAGLTTDSFLERVKNLSGESHGTLWQELRAIAERPKFKYSRLFAIGLHSLLEQIEPEAMKDEKRRDEIFQQIAEPLKISAEKMQKDIELYRGNLDKMAQAQAVLEDILRADRKKREEREQAKNAETTSPASAES